MKGAYVTCVESALNPGDPGRSDVSNILSSAAPLSHISHRAHWEHGISRGASLAASGLGVLRARGADLLVKGLDRCILPWQAPHGQRLTSR